MTTKRHRLSDMELDEISLVPSGDDPLAKVLIAKAEMPMEDDEDEESDLKEIREKLMRSESSKKKSARRPSRLKAKFSKRESQSTDANGGASTVSNATSGQQENQLMAGEIDKSDLPDDVRAYIEELEGFVEDMAEDIENGTLIKAEPKVSHDVDLSKADPALRAAIEKRDQELADLRSTVEKSERREAQRAMIEKASAFKALSTPTDEVADFLLSLADRPDVLAKAEAILKAASAQAETGSIFGEIGKTGAGSFGENIDGAVAEIVAKTGVSKAEASVKVFEADPTKYEAILRGEI